MPGDWEAALLQAQQAKRSAGLIDSWIASNPDKGRELIDLVDAFVTVRKDNGSKGEGAVSYNTLYGFCKQIGLRCSFNVVVSWVRRRYPDVPEL